MQPVEIRGIGPKDLGMWLPLWQSYQRFYGVNIPESETFKTWERLLNPAEPVYAALATAGKQVLGLVHFISHRSTWTLEDYCYIQDLFVTDNARGGGIGRALIEHVYAEARRRGASRVYWSTHESNQSAMQLYDRIADRSGFIQYRKLFA